MTTKKDLAKKFEITLNTVRKTLEACGLDTSKSDYSEEEIRDCFEVARTMVTEEKKGYAEVAAHFGVTMTGDETSTPGNEPEVQYEEVSSQAFDPLRATIRAKVQSYVQEVTDQAMQDMVAQLPQMIFESAQKVVRSGAIDAAFEGMLEKRRALSHDFSNQEHTIDVPAGGLPFVDDDDSDDYEIEITRTD
jgi:hypothetical protein